MTNTKANNVHPTGAIPRRGFFAAIAATVAGVVGLGRGVTPTAAASSAATTDTPVISTHPHAVPRTDEGSRRHG